MFDIYKKRLSLGGRTSGQAMKAQSDMIIENTWNNDIQSRVGYIYDFYHDDSPTINSGMTYENTTKEKVDIKFIITQYSSISKDQVEYHIMFKPSHECECDYYEEQYHKKYWADYPIGLYIDIPDDRGVYNKWIICTKEIANQFVKYSVLPCNFYFHWIYQNTKHAMWGVARLRNSYNSGIWEENYTTTVENQDSMWLPMNEITEDLYYNQRVIISAPIKNPVAWQISKVENLHPHGINKLTVFQVEFNPNTDKLATGIDGDTAIYWYANYSKSEVVPEEDPNFVPATRIKLECKYLNIKVGGGSRTINYSFITDSAVTEDSSVTMSFYFGDDEADTADSYFDSVVYGSGNKIVTIKLKNDVYEILGKVLTVKCVGNDTGLTDTFKFEILGL